MGITFSITIIVNPKTCDSQKSKHVTTRTIIKTCKHNKKTHLFTLGSIGKKQREMTARQMEDIQRKLAMLNYSRANAPAQSLLFAGMELDQTSNLPPYFQYIIRHIWILTTHKKKGLHWMRKVSSSRSMASPCGVCCENGDLSPNSLQFIIFRIWWFCGN